MRETEILNNIGISLIKKVLCGALGSIVGAGIGTLIRSALDKLVSYKLCEPYIFGLGSGYSCPYWHPHTWSSTLIALGFILGPSVLSIISKHFFKKKLYNPINALVVSLIVFISLILILGYLFSPIKDIA